MNWRHTGWLALTALALAVFVLGIERPLRVAHTTTIEAPQILPEFDPLLVDSILVRSTTNAFAVVKHNGAWEVHGPVRRPAKSHLVEALLREIASLRGASILNTAELRSRPGAPAEFGLNPAALAVSVASPTAQVELRLGARNFKGDQIFYQVAGRPGIFVAKAGLLDQLPGDPEGWRDTALVPVEQLTFDRLRVSGVGAAFTLARSPTNGSWELTEPRAARADSHRVSGLLRQLGYEQVLRFLAPTSAPPLDVAGLRPPRLVLTLSQGTNEVFQVSFGGPVTNLPAVYAQRPGEDSILAVPLDAFELLRVPYKNFLDGRIVRYDRGAVREIEFSGVLGFRVVRHGQGWRLLPDDVPADDQLVARLLAHLSTLEVVDIVKEVVTALDLANYGLAPPTNRITLRSAANTNAVLAVLETGALRESRVFARVPGEEPVYALNPADVAELPTATWQLRDRGLWRFDSALVSAIAVRHQDIDWTLRRLGTNDWTVPAGWRSEINPFALDEALFRLGQARVFRLVGDGDSRGPALGTTNGPQVTIEFRASPPIPPLRLSFGKSSPAGNRYGAMTAPDGVRLVFELSGTIFNDLWRQIGLPDAGGPPLL